MLESMPSLSNTEPLGDHPEYNGGNTLRLKKSDAKLEPIARKPFKAFHATLQKCRQVMMTIHT
jgi:hypothetical protein